MSPLGPVQHRVWATGTKGPAVGRGAPDGCTAASAPHNLIGQRPDGTQSSDPGATAQWGSARDFTVG